MAVGHGKAKRKELGPSGHLYTDAHWVYEIAHPRRDFLVWKAEKQRLMAEFDQEEIWIIQYEGRQI